MATVEELQRDLERHIGSDEKLFDKLDGAINAILNNHLSHIEPDVASLKANVKWLTVLVLMVIGGIVGLYFKH